MEGQTWGRGPGRKLGGKGGAEGGGGDRGLGGNANSGATLTRVARRGVSLLERSLTTIGCVTAAAAAAGGAAEILRSISSRHLTTDAWDTYGSHG